MPERLSVSPSRVIPLFFGIACVVLEAVVIQQHWRSLPQRELDMLLAPAAIMSFTQVVRLRRLWDALRRLQNVKRGDVLGKAGEEIATTESLMGQLLSISFVVEMLLISVIGALLR